MTEQLPLIQAESDEALFLPREQMQKRYTATTVEKLEMKRNYIIDLLACGWPVDAIAAHTQSSTRTVNLLGAKYVEQVGASALQFAQVLRAKAARFLFLADQKAPQAKFGELMVGVGIAAQRAQEMELGSSALLENHPEAIEVTEESETLKAARKAAEEILSRQTLEMR